MCVLDRPLTFLAVSDAPEEARQERQNLEALLLQFNANTIRVTEEMNLGEVREDTDRMWHDHVGTQHRHYATLQSIAPLDAAMSYTPRASVIERMLSRDDANEWTLVDANEDEEEEIVSMHLVMYDRS